MCILVCFVGLFGCFGSELVQNPVKNRNCVNNNNTCSNSTRPEYNTGNQFVSFTGVYIVLSCLVVLLAVSFYVCCGQRICHCTCHCLTSIKSHGDGTLGSTANHPSVRPTTDQEIEVQSSSEFSGRHYPATDTVETNGNNSSQPTERHVPRIQGQEFEILPSTSGDAQQSSESAARHHECTESGLPPSYSYLESIAPGGLLRQTSSENKLRESSDRISVTSVSLPPSYSTVLAHVEDYDVHVY